MASGVDGAAHRGGRLCRGAYRAHQLVAALGARIEQHVVDDVLFDEPGCDMQAGQDLTGMLVVAQQRPAQIAGLVDEDRGGGTLDANGADLLLQDGQVFASSGQRQGTAASLGLGLVHPVARGVQEALGARPRVHHGAHRRGPNIWAGAAGGSECRAHGPPGVL